MYCPPDEPNVANSARALRAGNPAALVAFNPGVKVPVVCHTAVKDYAAGEVNLEQVAEAVRACRARWIEREGRRVQFQILSFLRQTWCGGERPRKPNDEIIGYVRDLAAKGGVITWYVPIQKSGLIPEPFVAQLRSIGRARATSSE